MTVEDCRVILKVHIIAAEQSGKYAIALALNGSAGCYRCACRARKTN